jgi:hypothetical protein
MRWMGLATIVLAAFGALVLATPSAAQYHPNKWCAVYGPGIGAADNCSFVSMDQCMATISGIGGFCQPNPFYAGPVKKPARHGNSQDRR